MKFRFFKKNIGFNDYIQYQELEKRRIASDLHDTSLQTIAHITNKIELAKLYIDVDPVRAKLELADVNDSLKYVIEEIRNTIYNLRPMSFDDLSFKEAIEQCIIDFDSKSEIKYSYSIENVEFNEDDQKIIIFRIIQECLNNCEKHSKAENVNVQIFVDDSFNIIISDDGLGFNLDDKLSCNHFGLELLKEKVNYLNGNINIESEENKGTKVAISIPYEK